MSDPFDTLGVPASMDLDPEDLERRYLALSRDSHPDFHGQNGSGKPDAATMAAVLARSAGINDAYRTLRDPWRRARALAERLDPGVLDRKKQLCPATLLEAMELAEAVAAADDAEAPELEQRIRRAIDKRLQRVREALEAGRTEDAAVVIHEARYYQKALADLRDPAPAHRGDPK